MILQRAFRVGVFAFGFLFAAGAAGQIPQAEPQLKSLPVDLPVTNGLIRWWPNLFDVHDEITGQDGVVMGILPPVEADTDDETEFGPRARWVQLQPAITNQVFTLTLWVRCGPNEIYYYRRLLGQESSEDQWFFQASLERWDFSIGSDDVHQSDWNEHAELKTETWQHLAIARRPDGTSVVWIDGQRVFEGQMMHPWPASGRWLTVGNCLKGDNPFWGRVRDLCAFDRVLTDPEVHAFHAAGLPRRLARNTPVRLAATGQTIPVELSTNVMGQSRQAWIQRRFTTEDGLPGNIVKAVLQARNGYLWVGTEAGLARFDGRHFQAFTAANTSALRALGETIWSLSEDVDGTIWAGIFGGLLRVRGLEFTAFTNGLPERFVLQAEPAGDGSVWVAGFKTSLPRGPCRLRRYYPDSGTTSAEVIVPGQLRRLMLATNGIWLAAEQPDQLYFWDGRTVAPRVAGTVEHTPLRVWRPSHELLPPAQPTQAWHGTAPGTNVWVKTESESDAPAFYWLWDSRSSHTWVARWAGPVGQETWLGTANDLVRLRQGQLEHIDIGDSEPGPQITSVCANREGGVWFGTEEDGLHFVKERPIRVYTARDGLSGNDVRSVCATPQGDLFAGTDKGLSRWHEGGWTHSEVGNIRGLVVDERGNPWYGLAEFGPTALRTGEHLHAVSLGLEWADPNSLLFARDGRLWIACERGLTWLRPAGLMREGETHLVPNPASTEPLFGRYALGKELPRIWPLGIVEGPDGSIWMGSQADGLFHLKDGRVESFTTKDGLAGNYCVPVYLDSTDALWIVGEGGLSRYRQGLFRKVTEQDGLPKDVLLDLVEDDLGNFWISGKRGIHRVARGELEGFFEGRVNHVRSLTLGVRDGLLTPECSSLHYPSMAKTQDGNIWVATRNGLASFDPHQVRLDTQPLPAVIEQVVVNRQEIPFVAGSGPGPFLKLKPGSGQRLEFQFSAISLLGADRVKFRYRLDGYDPEWSPETDLRLAFYTNLRPGKYRFRVKAANAHGIWNDQDTALGFVILPYFWQTMPFYLGCGLGATMLAGAVHWRRLAVQRRLQELRHQQALTSEKARIAADMHDELGAALTQIAILGEVAKGQSSNESQTRSTLERISQAARDVTAGMSDLVWATNPRNDTLENLMAYLREHAASQFENTPIHLHFELPSDIPKERVSATFRRNLLLVMKESLNNIIKHAGASEVCVQLEARGPGLLLRVRDNGRGFEPALREAGGNGLGNMRKRVKDVGGDFTLRSAPHEGTDIEVCVPINPLDEPRLGNGS